MKNILLIAFMLTALTGYANNIKPEKFSENVTTVTFKYVKKGQQLFIKDLQENILYKENVEYNGEYIKYFDLTSLDNGAYTVVLDQDVKTITKRFEVLDHVVKFDSAIKQVFFKPTARLRGEQILISQIVSSDEALDISIYYNNELIKEETLSNATVLNRIYQLSNDKRGDYVITMISDGKTFYKNFTL